MKEIFVSSEEIARQKEIARSLADRFAAEGKSPRVCVETYGCQQNEADSERIRGAFALCGCTQATDIEDADVIVFNTCAIREHAGQRVLAHVGRLKKRKQACRELIVMFCGCLAQDEATRKQIAESYPYVDVIFGTDMHHRIPEIFAEALASKKRLTYVSELPHGEFGVISEEMPVCRQGGHRAWLSVMYGCNNFCSYCIVPFVRGRERSRHAADILSEAEKLVASGVRDITLLGQNVNSYAGEMSFPELLDRVASFDGDYWVRFMTSHPKDASRELMDVMASNPRVAHHFHLPVQSGNDRVLSAMNRRYTRAEYLEKVAYLKEKVPDVSLTSDIICGFPGETEEEFADTLSLVEKVGYDMLYIFLYSPRPGTVAAGMAGQIPHEEQVRRFDALGKLQNAISERIAVSRIGQTVRVLSDGGGAGRTSGNTLITLNESLPAGVFVQAEVCAAHPYSLEGKIK